MQEPLDETEQYYDRGKAYLQNGRIEKAIENLKKVIQLQPDFAEAHFIVSAAYYMLQQNEQTIVHLQKCIILQPQSAMVYLALGNVYANSKQPQKAIECYQKAAEFNPNDATPHYCLGSILCQLGEYSKAIDNFRIAIDLQIEKEDSAKDFLVDVYINMGVALIELKQYTQAVLSLIKALQLQSEDARAYNNIGVAYAALGQYDSAIEHLQQAIEIEPNNASAHFNLGIVFSRLDKHNKAVNHFSRIIHESEDDIQSSPLEVLYAQLRQPGNLFMTPQQVLAIQSDEEVKAHSVFAEALSGKSQYEAAILSYKKAIELQPDNAMAYYNLGKLYFKHHQELQGIECFSKVIELQPDDKIYQKTLDTIISIGDGRVVEPLIFALNSNDKYSRFVSVSKLGEIGDERAIKPLIELLDDSDEVMRQYAAKALIKLREKAVAPLILTAKSHKSAGVRWNAAYILRKIGTSDALRALEEIGKQGAEGKKEIKKRAFRRIRQEEGYSRKRSLWSIFGGR